MAINYPVTSHSTLKNQKVYLSHIRCFQPENFLLSLRSSVKLPDGLGSQAVLFNLKFLRGGLSKLLEVNF